MCLGTLSFSCQTSLMMSLIGYPLVFSLHLSCKLVCNVTFCILNGFYEEELVTIIWFLKIPSEFIVSLKVSGVASLDQGVLISSFYCLVLLCVYQKLSTEKWNAHMGLYPWEGCQTRNIKQFLWVNQILTCCQSRYCYHPVERCLLGSSPI